MRSSRSNCVNGESLTILRPDISVKPSAPVSCGEWSARPYTVPTNITLWNIYYKIVVVLFSVMMKHHGHRCTLGNAIFMKSSQARTEVVWGLPECAAVRVQQQQQPQESAVYACQAGKRWTEAQPPTGSHQFNIHGPALSFCSLGLCGILSGYDVEVWLNLLSKKGNM